MNDNYPIPSRLNLAIAAGQILAMLAILISAAAVGSWWGVALLALAYGLIMNSAYAMLHEAEHNLFHPNPRVNAVGGVLLALFFPAPFHLLRQGHLGHHMRNRSDDEAFDLYFEGESPFWKRMQLYGILTGMFWVVILLSNLIAVIHPRALTPKSAKFVAVSRPSEALFETLNSKYLPAIWIEGLLVFALHGSIMLLMRIPPERYFAVLFGFGFIWSAMQYAHHYGTNRDVRTGARNLATFRWLDLLWLNHNWHLNHHMDPTVPWIHLPKTAAQESPRGGLIRAYLAMWRGPQKTNLRVQNRFAGKIIR